MTTAVGYAGTCANDTTVYSGDAWTTPANCQGSGAFGGSTSTNGPNGKDQSDGLKSTNFGFALPSSTTSINGIQVDVETGWGSYAGNFNCVRIVKGGTVQSTDLNGGVVWGGPSLTVTTFGGPTQLWGTTWTYSDINNSGFGVLVAGLGNSASATMTYYGTRITVYYTVPGGSVQDTILVGSTF